MKKLFFTSILLLSLLQSATAQSSQVKELDAKNGFRDVAFGTSPNGLHDAVLYQEKGDIKVYRRGTDELKIGEAALSKISYLYYKDKLLSVLLGATGKVNSYRVLETLRAAYGVAYQQNKHKQEYFWQGEKVSMSYEEDAAGDAQVIITSLVLEDLRRQAEFNRAEKAKSDL